MSEHGEQVSVVEWCEWNHIPVFAIPNGANKSIAARMKFKAEGLRSGIPDLMIPLASGYKHGLFVEMKSKKGVVSEKQAFWMKLLEGNGYEVKLCRSADAAIAEIKNYLGR
mgnify:CR=1 FL=1